MSDDDSHTTMGDSTLLDDIHVPFKENDSRLAANALSKLYFDVLRGQELLPGFDDRKEFFNQANEFYNRHLVQQGEKGDIPSTWKDLFAAALQDHGHEVLTDENIPTIIRLIIRLSRTPPTIFQGNFYFQETFGSFCMQELDGKPRHDMLSWIAAYELLGKNFELDEWPSTQGSTGVEEEAVVWEEATKVTYSDPVLDPNEVIMEIIMEKGDTLKVKRSAKEAVVRSLECMKSQPTLFYKRRYSVFAVSQVLGEEFLEYAIPDITTLEPLDWTEINPERPVTWPKQAVLDRVQWSKFRIVHKEIVKEKDAEARADGLPKSGVQSCETYRQRFQEWRFMAGLYRRLFPRYTKQAVLDRMEASLKFCNGADTITGKIGVDVLQAQREIKAYDKQMERLDAQKKKVEEDLKTAAAAEANALKEAEDAQREKQALEHQAQSMAAAAPAERDATRRETREQIKKRKQEEAANKEALEKRTEEQEAKRQRLLATSDAHRQKAELLRKEQEKWQQAQAPPPQDFAPLPTRGGRRVKKNDITLLETLNTPRDVMHQDGEEWKPPMKASSKKNNNKYSEPGIDWEENSTSKIKLMARLCECLKADGILYEPMKFHTFMTAIGIDQVTGPRVGFEDRVFIYLLALVLHTNM